MKGVVIMTSRNGLAKGQSGRLPNRKTVEEINRINRGLHSMYILFSVFTGVYVALMWFEAFQKVGFLECVYAARWTGISYPACVAYNAFLAIYVYNKEQTRKCLLKRTTRRGGRWVAIWWLSLGTILLLQVFVTGVSLPHLLVPQCIIVLFVFFGSEAFKKRFIKKMGGQADDMIDTTC